MTKKIILGAHMSTSGGYHKAYDRGESVGCTAMQIFTKSNRMWRAKKITEKDAQQFIERGKQSPIKDVCVHASYLINLAAKNPDVEKKSVEALTEEINRCNILKIPYLIFHPGSHVGAGEEIGIEQIAKNLDTALEKAGGSTMVLLETMAGQGTNIGYTFEQLKAIRKNISHKKRVGICFDTCHVFAAGYDLSNVPGYKKTMQEFDDVLGMNLLKVVHLNDSKTERGSRKDRHAPIGEGKIPMTVFEAIMQDPKLKAIPKVLETPTDEELKLYKKEIALLSKF